MHSSIATPELTANHHTGNGRDHLCIVERPDAHIIFSSWCSSHYSLSRVIQQVNYTQVQNFNNSSSSSSSSSSNSNHFKPRNCEQTNEYY